MKLEKRKILLIILSLHLMLFGIVVSELIGLDIYIFKIVRAIAGLIYLTFVPGILLLFIMGLSNLEISEVIVYSVGISLTFLMSLGFLMDIIYPLIGISKPFSELSIFLTLIIATSFLLTMLFFQKDNSISLSFSLNRNHAQLLFCFLLPLLTLLASTIFTYYNKNLPLLLLLIIISLIPIYSLTKIPSEMYPLVIWTTSISLLLYGSLSSRFVNVIGDSHREYYFANLVKLNKYWNPNLPGTHNGMLSIVILHPVYSMLLGISINESFKLVYPLLFSFVPVILYIIYKQHFNNYTSFLAAVLFMFNYVFYNSYANSTRFGISFLFLSLIVMLIFKKGINETIRKHLLFLFSFGLIMSHYTTAYIFGFFTSGALFILTIILNKEKKTIEEIKRRYSFMLPYIIFLFAYYIFVTSSTTFEVSLSFFKYLLKIIHSDIFSNTYVGYALTRNWPISIRITMYFLYLFILLFLYGILYYCNELKLRKLNSITWEYFVFSIIFAILIPIGSVTMLGAPRAYFMSLLFISPLIVLGFIKSHDKILKVVFNITKKETKIPAQKTIQYSAIMFSLLLMTSFLVSSGFFSEIIVQDGDYAPSVFINRLRINEINDPYFILALYRRYTPIVDVCSAVWLSTYRLENMKIYVDAGTGKGHIGWATLTSYGMINIAKGNTIELLSPKIRLTNNSYIYLRSYVHIRGFLYYGFPVISYKVTELKIYLKDKIYTNGGSEIYLT